VYKAKDIDETLLRTMTDAIVDEAHPEEVFLFGSYAKGMAHDNSDMDLLVVMPDSDEMRHYRRRLTGRLYRRLASLPISKDILVYTRGEVERWRNVPGHIVATGLSEGKRLYGQP
jgi:uncharacterized protein